MSLWDETAAKTLGSFYYLSQVRFLSLAASENWKTQAISQAHPMCKYFMFFVVSLGGDLILTEYMAFWRSF